MLKYQLIAAGHPLDEVWLDSNAIVCDGRVGICHLKRGDVEYAERQRWYTGNLIGDAESSGRINHVVQPDELADAQVATVGGAQGVLLDRQRARTTGAVVVTSGVDGWVATGVIEGAWRSCVDLVGWDETTGLDRGRECKGLERRTGWASVLGGDVELELFEAGTTDHCSNRSGTRLNRDEAGDNAELVFRKLLGYGVLGKALSGRIERGVNFEATLEDGVDTVGAGFAQALIVEQTTLYFFNEVGVEECVSFDLAVTRQLACFPNRTLFIIDESLDLQPSECHAAAIEGVVWPVHRVVETRVGDHSGEQCGLAVGEGARVFVEVQLCCSLDAIGTATEVDGVEVTLEDLVLGHLLFEAHRDRCLWNLSIQVLLAADNTEFDQLLGDR